MKILFIDKSHKLKAEIENGRVMSFHFTDSPVGNIYRARVDNSIEYINGYFIKLSKNETGFLKTDKKLNRNESILVQIVRDKANNKPYLLTQNYKIETRDLYLKAFSNKKDHIYPKDFKLQIRDQKQYDYLKDMHKYLEREKHFSPTPKLLYENVDNNIENYDKVEYGNFYYNQIISKAIGELKNELICENDISILVHSLETLTVIDVNSYRYTDLSDKEVAFLDINKRAADLIARIIKLKNIGGMIVIDFLRIEKKDVLLKLFDTKLRQSDLDFNIEGFGPLGLLEMTVKRKGDLMINQFKRRSLIKEEI